jgi:putative DNA primase/helicase
MTGPADPPLSGQAPIAGAPGLDPVDDIDDIIDIPSVERDRDVAAWCARRGLDDLGNAERLRARYGDDLLYVRRRGWHAWTGSHWDREAGEDKAHLLAQRTAAAIRQEARLVAKVDEDRAKALNRYAVRARSSGSISAMLREARPHLTVALALDAMDAHPELLACANGTLELGPRPRLRAAARGDRIARVVPVAYDEQADYPLFKEFLQTILPNPEVHEFVQRFFGYALTGYAVEQVLVIFHGTGANGKSTLVDTLRAVFGDYAVILPFSSLLADSRRRGGEATPDLARLPGVRRVTASEPELGRAFSEAVIKTLTGEARMIARHLREEFFEFTPQFKLVLSCNNKPTVRGNDEGTWRRVLLVPFGETIPVAERDKHLPERLAAEAPGILNWVVEGARLYLTGGLAVPDAVRMATGDYRDESDPMGEFLREWVRHGDDAKGETLAAGRLFAAYEAWCNDSMVKPLSQNRFGRKMTDRGYRKVLSNGVRYLDTALSAEAERALTGAAERGRDQAEDGG